MIVLQQEKKFIGNGRSARVYLSTVEGKAVATKIFTGEPTSKIILFVLTGSANPYNWCEDAIKSAMIRRRILTSLCQFWFDKKVRLPETYGYSWNEEVKAFQIEAEFIPGCHAPLINPMKADSKDYASELRQEIMEPLQDHLIDSGFDGLVWQAGKGNPVADSNFMLLKDKGDSYQWIWIDLESGVPAIFAMNFLSTLTYYLPKCVKHGEWMFDTVDTAKLETYLDVKKADLIEKLGEECYSSLKKDSQELQETQNNWKKIKRYKRSVIYAKSQDKISQEEFDRYLDRPIAWYMKTLIKLMVSIFTKSGKAISKLAKWFVNINYRRLIHHSFKYITSARYRWGVARWYLQKDIKKWYARKSIDNDDRKYLLSELHKDEVSTYLTDFSVHLALKPLDMLITFFVIPLITATSTLSVSDGVFLAMAVGPVLRSTYTIWRFTHSVVRKRRHFPIIALLIGALPVVGNIAYPAELFFRGSKNRDQLAKFILYSFAAKIGAKIPVWGGKDSGTEHFFNRWSNKLLS